MSKHVTFISWDDVPYLSDRDKELMLSVMRPEERDARTKGIPINISTPGEMKDGAKERVLPFVLPVPVESRLDPVDGEKVQVPSHWKKEDRITSAQAAAILKYKQTRSIRRLVTQGKLRSAGTGYISVPSLLEFLDQKRPSPQS